jgi:proteasome alpha subunit
MYAPDGRIIQTEYAREAMRRGSIAVGLRSNAGVVLAGKLNAVDLDFPNSKISEIDEHISAIFSGYAADGRVVIQKARVEAAIHKLTYDESIDLKNLATTLADYTHQFTVQGGLRPLGIGVLIGGVDEHDNAPHVYFLNPGGAFTETRAKAIGEGDAKAMKFLKEKNDEKNIDDLNMEELIKLAQETVNHVTEEDLSNDEIEVWSMEIS